MFKYFIKKEIEKFEKEEERLRKILRKKNNELLEQKKELTKNVSLYKKTIKDLHEENVILKAKLGDK